MTITLPAKPFHLSAGAHSDPDQGACFMELAALLGRFAREPIAPELLPSAIALMDRMLPETPLKAPVIENAEIICAAPNAR